jgi:hypothetical protein
LCAELGVERVEHVPILERELVQQAASISLRSRRLQAQIIYGVEVDDDRLIRLSSETQRLLDSVRLQRNAAAKLRKAGFGA